MNISCFIFTSSCDQCGHDLIFHVLIMHLDLRLILFIDKENFLILKVTFVDQTLAKIKKVAPENCTANYPQIIQ